MHTDAYTYVNTYKSTNKNSVVSGVFSFTPEMSPGSTEDWRGGDWGYLFVDFPISKRRRGRATKWCQSSPGKVEHLAGTESAAGGGGGNHCIYHVMGKGTGWTAAVQLACSTAVTNSCRTQRLSGSLPIKARFPYCFS